MVNIIFFTVVVLVVICIIFDRLKKDKKWVSIMVTYEDNRYKLDEKYAFLKTNGIRCRVKNIVEIGTDQALKRWGVNASDTQSVSLDIYYKDIEKAKQLLSK